MNNERFKFDTITVSRAENGFCVICSHSSNEGRNNHYNSKVFVTKDRKEINGIILAMLGVEYEHFADARLGNSPSITRPPTSMEATKEALHHEQYLKSVDKDEIPF